MRSIAVAAARAISMRAGFAERRRRFLRPLPGPVSVKGFRSALLHAVKKIQIDWDHAIAYGSPVPGLRGNSRSPGVPCLPLGSFCLSHEVGARRGAPDTPAAS